MNINEDQIKKILNNNLGVDYWIFELGVGYVYESSPPNIRHSAPYLEYGKKLWDLLEPEIHELICDKDFPKDWLNELLEGDIRNLILGIVSAVTAKYDIGLGIAIPIAALVIKKGIKDFCKLRFQNNNEKVDIRTIIKNSELRS
ncbi:MAG: hypothetical protein F9K37_01300 [Bacteroidales bacterium]|nr:MAG: hypothetical protein F9K37_01300 [Bacteroidales bacterium]